MLLLLSVRAWNSLGITQQARARYPIASIHLRYAVKRRFGKERDLAHLRKTTTWQQMMSYRFIEAEGCSWTK